MQAKFVRIATSKGGIKMLKLIRKNRLIVENDNKIVILLDQIQLYEPKIQDEEIEKLIEEYNSLKEEEFEDEELIGFQNSVIQKFEDYLKKVKEGISK